MKKQTLIMLSILLLSIGSNVSAQLKDKICYTTTERIVQKLPYEVDINSLATHEIFSTRIVTVQKSFTESVDDKDNYTTSYKYLYHKNYFPDWYLVPDETIMDETGITNYFTSTTTLYDGGWQGHNFEAEAYNSEYIVDLKGSNPQKKYFTGYTNEEYMEYDWMRQEVIKNGLIKQFVFNPPTTNETDQWILSGYNVVITATKITVSDGQVSLEWDLTNKTLTTRIYESSTVVSKEIRYYEFNTDLSKDLIKTIENTEYLILTTGDCAEEVSTTDYVFDIYCSEFSLRKGDDKAYQEIKASLFPNPAPEKVSLEVEFPKKSQKMEVIIYDQIGSTVSRKVMTPTKELSIDISTLNPGIYTLGINVDNKFKSIQFVKQ